MRPVNAVLYGDAVGAAVVYATRDWRTRFAPDHSYEGLLGGPLVNIETTVTQKETGRSTIHVRMTARKASCSDQYYFVATVKAGELSLETIIR